MKLRTSNVFIHQGHQFAGKKNRNGGHGWWILLWYFSVELLFNAAESIVGKKQFVLLEGQYLTVAYFFWAALTPGLWFPPSALKELAGWSNVYSEMFTKVNMLQQMLFI